MVHRHEVLYVQTKCIHFTRRDRLDRFDPVPSRPKHDLTNNQPRRCTTERTPPPPPPTQTASGGGQYPLQIHNDHVTVSRSSIPGYSELSSSSMAGNSEFISMTSCSSGLSRRWCEVTSRRTKLVSSTL